MSTGSCVSLLKYGGNYILCIHVIIVYCIYMMHTSSSVRCQYINSIYRAYNYTVVYTTVYYITCPEASRPLCSPPPWPSVRPQGTTRPCLSRPISAAVHSLHVPSAHRLGEDGRGKVVEEVDFGLRASHRILMS